MEDQFLTLIEAHTKYPQLSVVRLRQLCQEEEKYPERPPRVQAHKRGERLWFISESSLKRYLKSDRKPGPKTTNGI